MKRRVVILCLLSALSACAPSIRGGSAGDPILAENAQQVVMEQGSEKFLRLDYTLEDFGLRRSDIAGAFWIPEGVDEESANMSTRFALTDVIVPAGWELELVDIRAYRTIETRYGRDTGEVTLRISPVLRLYVPADADLGESTVRAELDSRDGEALEIELPVRVRAPQIR
ncbi:MAG TPA: hypothetical protein VF168_00310 [Trueperaceae bacterium]